MSRVKLDDRTTGVCTTEYHSTTEYQFFYFSYKILRKHAIYFIFVNIFYFQSQKTHAKLPSRDSP